MNSSNQYDHKEDDEPDTHFDTDALYWLTFIDALERLDTLMLEVRNLQVNMIYLLRAPFLCGLLRYEEQFLWGSRSGALLNDQGDNSAEVSGLAVPAFPQTDWSDKGLEDYFKGLEQVDENYPYSNPDWTDLPISRYLNALHSVETEHPPPTRPERSDANNPQQYPELLEDYYKHLQRYTDAWEQFEQLHAVTALSKISATLTEYLGDLDRFLKSMPSREVASQEWFKQRWIDFTKDHPTPVPGKTEFSADLKQLEALTRETLTHIRQATLTGRWNRNQHNLYANLGALQALKRTIFHDKLFMCRLTLRAFGIGGSRGGNQVRPRELQRFLVLRAVIVARARDYVSRIGDHQAGFAAHFEASLQDHPRPIIGRRRDQHMYTTHLRDRTTDIANEMGHLLSHLGVKLGNRPAPVFHRWQHDFSSHSHTFRDRVTERSRKHAHQFFHYINTSYWMPERPDLQSVIAHEVAHGVLREYLDDLTAGRLDQNDDSFTDLLKSINQILQHFAIDHCTHTPQLREIAVDLLAIACKGNAYLHALFLELIGSGLEEFFVIDESSGHYELLPPDWLEGHADDYAQAREWYLRIRIAAAWLTGIQRQELSGKDKKASAGQLAERHIKACNAITTELEKYLETCSPGEFKIGAFWRPLVEELAHLVEHSPAAKRIGGWRADCRKERTKGSTRDKTRHYPRSTRALDPKVRKLITDSMLANKIEMLEEQNERRKMPPGPDATLRTQIIDQLTDAYSFKAHEIQSQDRKTIGKWSELLREALFEHLYDIPWQAAMLRGLDLAHKQSCLRPDDSDECLWQLHQHTALGRDHYQVALDFHVHDHEPAGTRLVEAIRLVKQLHDNLRDDTALKVRLNTWLGRNDDTQVARETAEKNIKMLLDAVREKANESLLCHSKEWLSQLYDARTLAAATPRTRTDSSRMRILEGTQGLKLKALKDLLDGKGLNNYELTKHDTEKENQIADFALLETYLNVSQSKSTENISQSKTTKDTGQGSPFYDRIINALSQEPKAVDGETDEQALRPAIGTRMLIRGCIAGWSDEFKSKSNTSPFPPLSWEEMVEQADWTSKPSFGPREKSDLQSGKVSYTSLIGRYDFRSVSKIRPMCRCPLPGFSDKDFGRKFPSFFVRREMVLPVRLGPQDFDEVSKTKMFAAISISLNRAAARLAFIYRLLDVLNPKPDAPEGSRLLPSLKGKIDDKFGDHLLLSDGWGDLLLVLGEPPSGRSLEDVFEIQSTLFEDFQVDRTELIMTRGCLHEALMKPELFSLTLHARLLEDRTMVPENSEFESQFWERLTHKRTKLRLDKILSGKVMLHRVPGRMDYVVRVNAQDIKDPETAENTAKALLYALAQTRTDRIHTSIVLNTQGLTKLSENTQSASSDTIPQVGPSSRGPTYSLFSDSRPENAENSDARQNPSAESLLRTHKIGKK